jgi:hypothetical protein
MIRVLATWFAVVTLALAWTANASAATLPGLRAAGADAGKWVVDDADFVLVVNVKQLAGAELMKKGGIDTFNSLLRNYEQARAIIDATGLEPFKDIDSILISGLLGLKTSDAKGLVVVRGRFDPDKAIAVARKKPEVEVLKEGSVQIIKLKIQDQYAYAAFRNGSTLVVTQSKEWTASWLKSGGKKSARFGAPLKKALGSFKGDESVTFALVINDELKKLISKVPQLAVAGPKLTTLTASFTVTDSAELKVVGAPPTRRPPASCRTR